MNGVLLTQYLHKQNAEKSSKLDNSLDKLLNAHGPCDPALMG